MLCILEKNAPWCLTFAIAGIVHSFSEKYDAFHFLDAQLLLIKPGIRFPYFFRLFVGGIFPGVIKS